VFSLESALAGIVDRPMWGSDLLKELRRIRVYHWRELPIEYTSEDLYEEAVTRGWLREEADGQLCVRLP
jgi:hypothetical protein